MADWIRWTKGLARKPEVLHIAAALNRPRREVAAILMELWEWADDNAQIGDDEASDFCPQKNGRASDICPGFVRTPSASLSMIDALVMVDGLAAALVDVGWIVVRKGCIEFPNFSRHNGKSAKKRMLDAERKKNSRAETSAKRPQKNGRASAKCPPRGEERREEEKREEIQESEATRTIVVSAGELPSDLSPAMLARQWCFVCTRRFNGRSKDDERDMTGEFANLEGLGVPAAAMLEEINRGPPQRDRGEHFWQFKDRLLERFNLKQQATGKPPKKSALDRLIEGAGTRKP